MNKREFIGGAALCVAAGLWIGGAFAATGAAPTGKSPDQLSPLIVNEPAEHFFVAVADQLELETDGKRNEFADLWDFRLPKEVDLSERGVERYVDALAGGNLTHYFINVNYQRSFFPSKTIEPIWTSLGEPGRQEQRFVRNLKAAFGRGLDVYAVMIRRCREKGVSPWISFRMNDIHDTQTKTSPMASTFWKEHPEWHIGNDASWQNGLDYAQEPVRDRMAAYIREALDRYDADGVEIDFIRFPYYFCKGTERKNAPILTAFLREIRAICDAAAKRRGHPVKIAARFLPNPAQAVGMGADVGVWSKEGLLDLAIACNMYGSIEYEYHVDAWRKVLTDKTQFITGTDNGIVVNGKRRILNLSEYRDWIAKMRRDGADGLYFFNFPLRPYCDETWRGVLGSTACERAIDVANFARPMSPSLVDPVLADAMLASSAGTIARAADPNAWPEEKGCLSAMGKEKMTHTISPMFCAFRRNAPTGESGADAFYGFYQAGETHTVENVVDPTELMRLSVLKAKDGAVTRSFVDVGVAGQDFGSFVQTTKRPPCAQTAIEKDGLLYLFFRGRREDMSSIWCYRNFDTRAGKLTDGATICTLDGREFNGVTARDAYNRTSGDHQMGTALANECTVKRFSDGWYYMIACVGGDCVGLVVRSQNLKDWSSVAATPDLGKGPTMEHEIAELAPGKWFSAWRQERLGGVWTASYDVSARTWSVPERVPDSIAVKPCLFARRGKTYLATNLKGPVTTPGYGTAVRATLGIFEVSVGGRIEKLQTIVNPTGCHYTGTVEDGAGNLYLCHSTDERKLDVTQCRSNISFFRFEP